MRQLPDFKAEGLSSRVIAVDGSNAGGGEQMLQNLFSCLGGTVEGLAGRFGLGLRALFWISVFFWSSPQRLSLLKREAVHMLCRHLQYYTAQLRTIMSDQAGLICDMRAITR